MFEATEFIDGPRNGEKIEHAEPLGQLMFPDGRYRLMIDRLSDEEFLRGRKPQKQWYQWHEAD